ncbi:MAG: hemolysin III family protein [Caldilinea sp. CFX5]|nr:hemolysin III family protein [Caldilinea sp. CFX5]
MEQKYQEVETLGEEIASAITHGIGTAFSIVGLTLLLVWAAHLEDWWRVVSVSIYGGALVFLYLASTLYHAIQHLATKRVFHILDHVGIFLLIAGTYTPILLIKMRDWQGWLFFGLIWGLALVGATIKAFFMGRYVNVSTFAYVVMGWLSLFLVKTLSVTLGMDGMAWLVAGGLSYSLGVIPFLWERLPFNHAIWHLFVIGGSVCHYVLICQYILP